MALAITTIAAPSTDTQTPSLVDALSPAPGELGAADYANLALRSFEIRVSFPAAAQSARHFAIMSGYFFVELASTKNQLHISAVPF
jgi:hypothetical protein